MFGLDPEKAGKRADDPESAHLEQAGHDGGNVPGVAHGHEEDLALQIPAVPLGDLIGIGFLPEDAPAVLGVEQSHAVMLGQMLHHLHAVVEDPGHFKHGRTRAQRLGKLLRGHFALRQEHGGLDGMAPIRAVEGGGSGGVPGGGTDGQHLVPAVLAHQRPQIAVGAGHAPVLEGGAGVLAVVLEGEGHAELLLQFGRALHDRRIAFAQIEDVFLLQHRGHELIKTEDAP